MSMLLSRVVCHYCRHKYRLTLRGTFPAHPLSWDDPSHACYGSGRKPWKRYEEMISA